MTAPHNCATVSRDGDSVVVMLDSCAVQALGNSARLLIWLLDEREQQWQKRRWPLGRPKRTVLLTARRGLHDIFPDGYSQEPEAGRFREYYEPVERRELRIAAEEVAVAIATAGQFNSPILLDRAGVRAWVTVLAQVRFCHVPRSDTRWRKLMPQDEHAAGVADFCNFLQYEIVSVAHPELRGLTATGTKT